jgi:hypothetical protein
MLEPVTFHEQIGRTPHSLSIVRATRSATPRPKRVAVEIVHAVGQHEAPGCMGERIGAIKSEAVGAGGGQEIPSFWAGFLTFWQYQAWKDQLKKLRVLEMILKSWLPPLPHPPTIGNVSASYFASRFALVETGFWLYTLHLVVPRVYARCATLEWAAASTTVIFLALTLPAGIMLMRARYAPLALALTFASAIANMLAWKHCIAPLR